ncbi:MAG: FAD-binding protein [Planctomycetia bacterium]|nr:MAG: FAD-binding protein [Planctomycetia bacterium]
MIQPDVVAELRSIVGSSALIDSPTSRRAYECDAFTLVRHSPGLVVLPGSADEVAAIVRLLHRSGIPFVPRGAGTGLAGGSIARPDAVMIGLNRMRRIRRIDVRNRLAEVEAGVANLAMTRAVAADGFQFAPDPSSQQACSIGGNCATNAGGPHTLKCGVTVNHILAIEFVTCDGRLLRIGCEQGDSAGLDLVGLIVGSEGTFGIVTAATVRLSRTPPTVRTLLAVFESIGDATQTVSDIIARGITPAAMEMMDAGVIEAVEAAFQVGLPLDAAAVLIIEVDGVAAGLDAEAEQAAGIARSNRARSVRAAANEEERAALWKSRKRAAGALGRITTSYCTQDGVVPRSELPGLMSEIATIAARHELRVANLVHAGDGNIHPILMYDENDPEQVRRVIRAGEEILCACIRRGGTVTGEHGIGVEKMDLMPLLFSPADLAAMLRLRSAFNPGGLCNPHKIFPDTKGCWEIHKPGKRAAI